MAHIDPRSDIIPLVHQLILSTKGPLLVLDKDGKPVEYFNELFSNGIGSKETKYYWTELIKQAKCFAISTLDGCQGVVVNLTKEEFKTITNARQVFSDAPWSC